MLFVEPANNQRPFTILDLANNPLQRDALEETEATGMFTATRPEDLAEESSRQNAIEVFIRLLKCPETGRLRTEVVTRGGSKGLP